MTLAGRLLLLAHDLERLNTRLMLIAAWQLPRGQALQLARRHLRDLDRPAIGQLPRGGPHGLPYWAAQRLIAHATAGHFDDHPAELTARQVLSRWYDPRGGDRHVGSR